MIDTWGIHHWKIFRSSYKKLAWVGFEPTTTEFRSYIYDFQQFERARYFEDSIYTGKINIDESEMDQNNLFKKYGRI